MAYYRTFDNMNFNPKNVAQTNSRFYHIYFYSDRFARTPDWSGLIVYHFSGCCALLCVNELSCCVPDELQPWQHTSINRLLQYVNLVFPRCTLHTGETRLQTSRYNNQPMNKWITESQTFLRIIHLWCYKFRRCCRALLTLLSKWHLYMLLGILRKKRGRVKNNCVWWNWLLIIYLGARRAALWKRNDYKPTAEMNYWCASPHK